MVYDIKDAQQALVGGIIASLFVVLVRAGNPINIDPTWGFWVGIIWIFIVTKPYITPNFETKVHVVWNIIITLGVTTTLSFVFNMVTVEQMTIPLFFGSTPWILMMISLPTATFWDKFNITNQYDRWYFRRRR